MGSLLIRKIEKVVKSHAKSYWVPNIIGSFIYITELRMLYLVITLVQLLCICALGNLEAVPGSHNHWLFFSISTIFLYFGGNCYFFITF